MHTIAVVTKGAIVSCTQLHVAAGSHWWSIHLLSSLIPSLVSRLKSGSLCLKRLEHCALNIHRLGLLVKVVDGGLLWANIETIGR